MVTVEQLATRCGTTVARDEDELTRALAFATAEVDRILATAWRPVPDVVRDECVLRTGYGIYKQAKTNDGGNFLTADGSAVPGVANDPMRKAWVLLKRYINRV